MTRAVSRIASLAPAPSRPALEVASDSAAAPPSAPEPAFPRPPAGPDAALAVAPAFPVPPSSAAPAASAKASVVPIGKTQKVKPKSAPGHHSKASSAAQPPKPRPTLAASILSCARAAPPVLSVESESGPDDGVTTMASIVPMPPPRASGSGAELRSAHRWHRARATARPGDSPSAHRARSVFAPRAQRLNFDTATGHRSGRGNTYGSFVYSGKCPRPGANSRVPNLPLPAGERGRGDFVPASIYMLTAHRLYPYLLTPETAHETPVSFVMGWPDRDTTLNADSSDVNYNLDFGSNAAPPTPPPCRSYNDLWHEPMVHSLGKEAPRCGLRTPPERLTDVVAEFRHNGRPNRLRVRRLGHDSAQTGGDPRAHRQSQPARTAHAAARTSFLQAFLHGPSQRGRTRHNGFPEHIRAMIPRNDDGTEPCLKFLAGAMSDSGTRDVCAFANLAN
ncbi:hypothetical protein PHYSODRAFT_298350 [Phytophthora sojae]|uniref:Uncharacterized protein n=1 Tax=Phytophthora sojae (strain P6497) TaxID=1094619 RepID=G4Z351_PHYSP|nr:hypothetical protein PHYSODRAFT_298350 [Phytophthora sojae]EGZ20080.1 hypothetical protein PHYSODRAFT_298350 [Phytophthora sojae]|eukprot:XP_009522797.1 hypothetical protein PHYSODRAFT_298350 [Phytophthora sojae]